MFQIPPQGSNTGYTFLEKYPKNSVSTIEPISTNSIPIDSTGQAETYRNFKIFSKFVLGEQSGNFREKSTPWITSQPVNRFSQNSVLIDAIHIYFAKQQILLEKKLISLKPVVRTRRSYKKAGLIKQQKSFKGLAMYGHEALMSLQTRAIVRTHFFPFM
jgi:hypothetical protein